MDVSIKHSVVKLACIYARCSSVRSAFKSGPWGLEPLTPTPWSTICLFISFLTLDPKLDPLLLSKILRPLLLDTVNGGRTCGRRPLSVMETHVHSSCTPVWPFSCGKRRACGLNNLFLFEPAACRGGRGGAVSS